MIREFVMNENLESNIMYVQSVLIPPKLLPHNPTKDDKKSQ